MGKIKSLTVVLPVMVVLSSCLLSPSYTPPPRLVTCTDDNVADGIIGGCKSLAGQGSASAMAHLGDYFDGKGDVVTAYDWYRKAADLNDLPTLRRLYDDYRAGVKVPRNLGLSAEFLNKAANLKAEWALLVLAKQSERTDPAGALATYQTLARTNNCFAQARLSLAYFHGDIAPRNVTQAYFWGLLATVNSANRKSDYHVDADLFARLSANQGLVFTCSDVKSIAPVIETEALLSTDRRQLAQDAATRWLPNLTEPMLPAPDGLPVLAASMTVPPALHLPPIQQSAFPPPDPDILHGRPAPDTVALIVGIDDYENAPRASFAERDAAQFRAFALSSLGIADGNVKLLLGHGARRLDVERALTTWLPAHIKPGKTSLILYFAGHGLTNDDGSDLFLLPYDGDRDMLNESAIRRERLIERLKASGAKHITMLLDACFSGLSRDGESLHAEARPLAIVPKAPKPSDGVTILSAAQGTQLSLALKPAGHGLFSYMMMKGLEGAADTNGDRIITMAELYAYTLERVNAEASRQGRKQTPVLEGDGAIILAQWD